MARPTHPLPISAAASTAAAPLASQQAKMLSVSVRSGIGRLAPYRNAEFSGFTRNSKRFHAEKWIKGMVSTPPAGCGGVGGVSVLGGRDEEKIEASKEELADVSADQVIFWPKCRFFKQKIRNN